MAKPLLNHAFTTREKGLILVLAAVALIALYFFAVVQNVSDSRAAGEQRSLDLQSQIAAQQKIAAACASMQKEIDSLGNVKDLPVVATYDNIRGEFDMLNGIFQSSESYTLTFVDPELSGSTVRRQAKVTFDAASFDEAELLVKSIEEGTYRCQVNDVSMTSKIMADGSSGNVTVNLSMTFFETTEGSSNLTGLQTETNK